RAPRRRLRGAQGLHRALPQESDGHSQGAARVRRALAAVSLGGQLVHVAGARRVTDATGPKRTGFAVTGNAGGSEGLERFGYAQQLKRGMGGFQSFALSFSVISILTGAVTLYGYGFKWGGPLVMGLGWPLVAFFTFFIALSMAELASAFPTAGALYHWSALL